MKEERQEFLMPSLGADMESGSVAEWLVKPGDRIRKGDVIAVVDTDKALIEVESFHTGVVEDLLVKVGERVPVGTALAVITGTGAGTGTAATTATAAPSPVVSPLVRHLAEQRGVDVTAVHGTGPGGRVTRADVEHTGPPAEVAGVTAAAGETGETGETGRAVRAGVTEGAQRSEKAEVTAETEMPRRTERVSPAMEAEVAERAGLTVGASAVGVVEGARVKVSPLARRLAGELGVDLAGVHGTGRTGAIRAEDVRAAALRGARVTPRDREAWAAPGQAVPEQATPTTGARAVRELDLGRRQDAMRQAIARAMARSNREIPHYHLATTVDMSAALAWLRGRNRDLPVSRRILPAALLLAAAARAAEEVPQLNGFWVVDDFVPGEAVHLGVAISLRGGGLIAPALHDAAGRGPEDLMAALKDLVNRARTGRLRDSEMTEATITVTNLGDQGVETVHGVIYPPQVALVGFGKILERPWAVGGLLGVRPLVNVTLAADHRATDGYTGGRFLTAVERLLNQPEEL